MEWTMTEATQKVIVEIGKCYEISPKWKKSYIEEEIFSNGTKSVGVETCWRGGTVHITPQNEDEVEWLQDALDSAEENEYGDAFEPTDFEEYEFVDAWDGCSEDYHYYGEGWTDEEKETLEESMEDEFASSVLEEAGYESHDLEVIIHNGIVATEIEPEQY
jgi:hypothetical protein